LEFGRSVILCGGGGGVGGEEAMGNGQGARGKGRGARGEGRGAIDQSEENKPIPSSSFRESRLSEIVRNPVV